MIVRRLDESQGTEREVSAETWTSRGVLLADDEMGFSGLRMVCAFDPAVTGRELHDADGGHPPPVSRPEGKGDAS